MVVKPPCRNDHPYSQALRRRLGGLDDEAGSPVLDGGIALALRRGVRDSQNRLYDSALASL
jgi:hypothetical protein